jgi:acetylornithine deacetylase/succinyl-diaminopimelate desuccinylase-like protein
MGRRALMERVVRELAAYERPSATAGEQRAAAWIAAELDAAGCRDARVEEEPAHGGYWWPLGLLNTAAALAARLGGLCAAALVGGLAAAPGLVAAGRVRAGGGLGQPITISTGEQASA